MVSVIARDLLDGVIFQIPTFQMHTFGFLFGVAIFSTTKIAEVISDQKIYHDNKNNKTINFGQIHAHNPKNRKIQPQDLDLGRNMASNQASLRVKVHIF